MSVLPPILRKQGPAAQWLVCVGTFLPGYVLGLISIWHNEPTFEGRITLTVWASFGYAIVVGTLLALAQPWNRENWR